MTRILVVEDEPAIQSLIAINFRRHGYLPVQALSAQAALDEINTQLPSLVVLDWMLPDRSGIDVLRHWRAEKRTARLPVLMLTAKSEDDDIVHALEIGADDYLTKPFSTNELIARIHALLRRARPDATQSIVVHGALQLDPASMRVTQNNADIKFSPLEFRLLHYFMKSPEIVHSRAKLLDAVWGDHVYIEERTVDVHIRRLRAILAEYGLDSLIETVRGGGYRLGSPADSGDSASHISRSP